MPKWNRLFDYDNDNDNDNGGIVQNCSDSSLTSPKNKGRPKAPFIFFGASQKKTT